MLAVSVVIPPLLIATVWFRRRSDRAYGQARESIATVNANFQENLSGVRVAQAYVREDRNIGSFRAVGREYLGHRLDAQRLVAIYFPFVLFLAAVADAIVLGVGSRARRQRHHRGRDASSRSCSTSTSSSRRSSSCRRCSTPGSRRARRWPRSTSSWRRRRARPSPRSPSTRAGVTGAIRFEDVHFRYPTAVDEALRGVDLEVHPGETVALVGETGAGKSTIVKLVARFYDVTAGRVLIDGVPVDELDLGAFRRRLGYVPQEPFLFSGTVRDNIAYGRPDASDAEVERAAAGRRAPTTSSPAFPAATCSP